MMVTQEKVEDNQQQPPPNKPKLKLYNFFGLIVRPSPDDVDPQQLAKHKETVAHTQKSQRDRLKRKQSLREKKKFDEKLLEKTEEDRGIRLSRDPDIQKEYFKLSSTNSDENRYQLFFHDQLGPSHFSTQSKEDEEIRQYKEKKKKRISQLYTGDPVYHHDLSRIWDHLDANVFLQKLDKETRKKYPISPEIQGKLLKIRMRNDKKAAAKSVNPNCCRKLARRLKERFYKTSFGSVFLHTPRYCRTTPVVPVFCRRCKHRLEDTLEGRWSPLGVAFAVLFPIVGLLCCCAYKEFVCVVCEEVYLLGDYPSKVRPFQKDRLLATEPKSNNPAWDVQLRKSFVRIRRQKSKMKSEVINEYMIY